MNAALDPRDFREAMARFASGVTVVTARDSVGKAVGFTASAFCSLSLDPPLLLVCLQKDADCHAAFMEAEQFGVSILAQGQSPIATRFATKAIDKWDGTPSKPGRATRIPLIEGAAARLECRVHSRADGGDHTILIGEVLTADANGDEPLLHFDRSFGRFVEEGGA